MIYLNGKHDIYLIAFWPSPETNEHNKEMFANAYLALTGTYDVSLQIISDPKEAMNLSSNTSVAIQQENDETVPLAEFEHPENAVYYVGNNKYPFPAYHFNTDHAVHIPVPVMREPLYGFQAAAIALHDRYMKNGTGL
ncbi:MAG: hypothetical protein JSW51_11590 [Gemmatimonadota bacterium]|nr:MAG: hypothetical protein JSW51_11590 [Gemmatimonadota bacterium]